MAGGLSRAEVERLYEKYGYLLLRRCRRLARDVQTAEDAFQSIFIKLLRHGASIRDATSELGWLYRVADRCVLDAFAAQKSRAPAADRPAGTGTAVQQGTALEARSILSALMSKLTVKDRLVAVLLFDHGLSQAEVSEHLGWSRQTINKKAKAIRELAEEMEGSL